ncbi:hypothetical protein BDZ89DRAFT_947562 [Hymenopellis radicata]|nr:hypothetical protein BDZ89DRAFT_947562 [Hymenopellis radicata]
MKVWRGFRQGFLEQLLRLDGTAGAAGKTCPRCNKDGSVAEHRCRDNECFSLGVVCSACIVKHHEHAPLHWVEKWTGSFFKTVFLRDLGLTVTLGHSTGGTCAARCKVNSAFVVLHTNGIHFVNVGYCGCFGSDPDPANQTLQDSWWPATPLDPHTAITFPLLRLAHSANSNGKLPAWDLWQSLEYLTEERTGVKPPQRYKALLRCLREWRHVLMCLDAGRGQSPTGIAGTQEGELALVCPACPQPGINIPDNWVSRDDRYFRWKFTLFLADDSNYRLKNAMVSTPERDPPLGSGWAFFVKDDEYHEYILRFVSQEDMANCSGFAAISLANLKNAKGLRTTGVTGVTCGRHGCWLPNGIGNLQRGERQCNVDFVLASALKRYPFLLKFLSYDIMCIYFLNLASRILQLPEHLQAGMSMDLIRAAIPKFHLWAHQPKDHAKFSYNYLPHVGRTHGEVVEGNWSQSNRAATQTKMMGPGARQDTLDDIFNFHNRRAIRSFEHIFPARLVEAIKESKVHSDDFENFDSGLAGLFGRESLDKWLLEVQDWERDFSKPCPYEPRIQSKKTINEVKLQLAKEEQLELAKSPESVVRESSASAFIADGMEIEELNALVRTSLSNSGYTNQFIVITRRLRKFRGIQQVFMPHVREYLSDEQAKHLDGPSDELKPEGVKLFLPSDVPAEHRKLSRACKEGLVDAEIRLREAECYSALDDLRRGLRTRSAGLLFQVRNVTGQNPTTRAEGIQRRVLVGINLAKLRYRWARNALYRLRGHGDWENDLKILEDKHRGLLYLGDTGPSSSNAVISRGEGRREISWIWYSFPSDVDVGSQTSDQAFNESLKIEWCKARARSLRWREEVELLIEEMRRVIEYRRWKATWWISRASLLPNADDALKEGASAHALAAADRETVTADRLSARWESLTQIGEDFLAGLPVTRVLDIEVPMGDDDDGDREDDTIEDDEDDVDSV